MRKKYGTYDGLPCKHGHGTTRYVSIGKCVECSRLLYLKKKEQKAEHYKKIKDSIKDRKAKRAKAYYLENRVRLLAEQKAYYQANKDLWILKNGKRRANGVPSHVSIVDIRRLLKLQRGRCSVCAVRLKKKHLDHIKPLSRGGRHEFTNLQFLCPTCNLNKHAKDPIDFMQSRGRLL